MAEDRALRFCTKGDYIKSCQRDDKSPQKGRGFDHVTHFCMHNCGVGKNSPRHSVNCDQQCHRRWTILIIAPLMVDVSAAIHYSLRSISLICHRVCCKLACTTYRNKSIKWSLSIIVPLGLCGNNRQFTDCVAICYRPMLVAWLLYLVGSAIWSILREAASRRIGVSKYTCSFLGASSVSQELLNLELSNFVYREIIPILPKG